MAGASDKDRLGSEERLVAEIDEHRIRESKLVEEALALGDTKKALRLPTHPTLELPTGSRNAANGAAANGDEAGPSKGNEFGVEGVDYTEGNVDEIDPAEWEVPPHCIPIHANVVTYDWSKLYNKVKFDVIMMDPPWQLATANPTRGVALGYSQLTDNDIKSLPIPQLQEDGFLFVWVINAKYSFCLELFDHWGYELVDEVVWVKQTVHRRLAKSHGYYLQHAKECCLVGRKGKTPPGTQTGSISDIIMSERRGQSQKPEEIYRMIEMFVPNGRYLEIFARKNNLRNFWVSVGNEVTGLGLPTTDKEALENNELIPGAFFGKTRQRDAVTVQRPQVGVPLMAE